jgi:hypothetical protein
MAVHRFNTGSSHVSLPSLAQAADTAYGQLGLGLRNHYFLVLPLPTAEQAILVMNERTETSRRPVVLHYCSK